MKIYQQRLMKISTAVDEDIPATVDEDIPATVDEDLPAAVDEDIPATVDKIYQQRLNKSKTVDLILQRPVQARC